MFQVFRADCLKGFPTRQFPLLPPNHCKFSINLLGHVAGLHLSGTRQRRLFSYFSLQKPVETAQDVLERAAKKGLMKPKAKPARINSPKEKPKPRAQADMSRLRIKETPGGNLSDNEEDRNSLKVSDQPRKPRSWHGSAEDVAKPNTKDVSSSLAPSESTPKKKGKKVAQPKPFMF